MREIMQTIMALSNFIMYTAETIHALEMRVAVNLHYYHLPIMLFWVKADSTKHKGTLGEYQFLLYLKSCITRKMFFL